MASGVLARREVVRRELLAVPVRLDEDERPVVGNAVGRVLDEGPEDESVEAMTAYAVRLGAAIALATALETGSLPAGTDIGPLFVLVRDVRLEYLEIIAKDDVDEDHWGRRSALGVIAGCESLLARLGTRDGDA